MNNLHSPSRKKKNRRKLGSRSYKDYTSEMLEVAVEMVEKKIISSREAEKQLGIPRRTILNKLEKKHMKPVGRQQKLTMEEEEKFIKVLIAAGDYGSPLTKLDLKMVVYKYLEKKSRLDMFSGKMPSNSWVAGFLERHKSELTIRTTQNIKKVRAEKGLQEMEDYFINLQETLKDVPTENILNYDETNLADDPGNSKSIFRRGIKYPERVLNSTKSSISIMFTACASGYCLPAYVVYKASHIYSEWIDQGPDGTRYNCTKSGWFDAATFVDYFKTIVIEWARKLTGPKVVIGDNLSSHLNIEVVELCQKHNIRFVFLPPNSTHLTQPLDVAFFAPLKKEWRNILLEYKVSNPAQSSLNKKHFPKLLAQLIEKIRIKASDNIKSGFRATGICPFNPRNVIKKIPEYFEGSEYGIESVLIDYLNEIRSPKPMAIKRAKKLRTEPGKSVCPDDISIKTISPKVNRKQQHQSTKDNLNDFEITEVENTNQETESNIQANSDQTKKSCKEKVMKKSKRKLDMEQYNVGLINNNQEETDVHQLGNNPQIIEFNEESHIYELNEITGEETDVHLLGKTTLNIELNEESHIYTLDEITGEWIYPTQIKTKKLVTQPKSHNTYNPKRLSEVCIAVVNNSLISSSHDDDDGSIEQLPNVSVFNTALKKDILNMPTSSASKVVITSNEKVNFINIPKHEIKKNIILPRPLIGKPALQMNLVCKKQENTILRPKNTNNEQSNSSKNQITNRKRKHITTVKKPNRKVKSKPNIITTKKPRTNKQKNKKKGVKKYKQSSSDDSDIQLSEGDTDNSDFATYEDFADECLREQLDDELFEKENLVPFGISEIDYFESQVNDINQHDWIIAKFSTKKSEKHYVGQVLSLKNRIPTVKFLRKIKNMKENKLMFTYPNVEDICEIKHSEDVVLVLPQPSISRRGQVMFEIDLKRYNLQ